MTHDPVIIGLGGNVGSDDEVLARLRSAVMMLEARLPVARRRCSPVYRSVPVGPVQEQPRFLNAVVAMWLATPMPPARVLAELLAVETTLGRLRAGEVAQGPRTIDLDLLFAGSAEIATPALVVPHPRLHERAFVLRPLADVMGEGWRMPGIWRTVAECLAVAEVARQDAALERVAALGA